MPTFRIYTHHGQQFRGALAATDRVEACAAARATFGIPGDWTVDALLPGEAPDDDPADACGGADEFGGQARGARLYPTRAARDATIFSTRAGVVFCIVKKHCRGTDCRLAEGRYEALFTSQDAAVAAEALLLRAGLLASSSIERRGRYAVVSGRIQRGHA